MTAMGWIAWPFAVLAADFVSGLVHWAEDTFGSVNTPIIGKWIVAPNVLHHEDGSAFTALSWWQSSWDLVLASALVLALSVPLGMFGGPMILFCFLGANANEAHKWNHLGSKRAGLVPRILWKLGFLQSPRHHLQHHAGQKNTRYCVWTPLLNPVLDRLLFWRLMERLFVPLAGGAPRREDIRW